MLENVLQQLGLNENEIKIYLALLPIGTVPASVLGTRVGIPRSTAKYTCQQLTKKGLFTAVNKNNTFLYMVKDPQNLHNLLESERQLIQKKDDELGRVMGDLKNLFYSKAVLPKVQFFEGAEAITKMLEDVLKEQQPLYGAINLSSDLHPVIASYFQKVYIPERKRLRFPSWMLFNDNDKTRAYAQDDFAMNRISLLVPEKDFSFDICFHIYGDKIAFYSYKSIDLVGVIIQDTYIRKMQFSLFKMAWNFAKALKENEHYRKVSLDD